MSIYFEGNTPYMSAFALVAIESVWPNPEGGELSADSYDMELLGMSGEGTSTGIQRKNFSPNDRSTRNTHSNYEVQQGYYKLLPLNVISVNTSSGLEGSSFEVKFTLDDMLLVTSDENQVAMSGATGLPISRADLASFSSVMPMFRPAQGVKYHTDEELGLTRYRISGANSGFNIEDLVTENDTITIWLYHDPKEFQFRDSDLDVVSEYGAGDWPTVHLNQDMSWVIGSGDRRGQYDTENPSLNEATLKNIGVLTEYMEAAMQSAVDGEQRDFGGVSRDNIYEVLDAYYMDARSVTSTLVNDAIREKAVSNFGSNGEYIANWILLPVAGYITDEGRTVPTLAVRRAALKTFIRELSPGSGEFLFSAEEFTPAAIEAARILGEPPDGLVTGINLFSISVNDMLRDHLLNSPNRSTVTRAKQNFANGRTIITSGDGKAFHGETPYMALKGQISGVKVAVGATQGSHTVTLMGKGMEKMLSEHEVYFDDMFLPDGGKAMTDFQYFYVHMPPGRAILSIVNSWAPKKIIMGKPTSWAVDVFQTQWRWDTPSDKDVEDLPRGIQKLEDMQVEIEETVPLRGNLVLSQRLEGVPAVDRKNTRIFAPLNYIDTTRIREMTLALERAYDNSNTDAVINTSKPLQGRTSVMQNLTNIIGVGQFYEIFVDETGRLRYRLTFEAMERTPNPIYTPIIQDRDLLSEGSSFSHSDGELKTLVDVEPLRGQHTAGFSGISFRGRSVPDASALPIIESPPGVTEESLSADLFRYGLRSVSIEDVYTSESNEAQRKAALYRGFFGKPVKRASLKVRGNTSYRVGETVLVALQKNKHRTRTIIDLPAMRNWLLFIKEDKDLIDMYIGVDERLLHTDYYNKTSALNPLANSASYYNEFVSDPKGFVLDQFLATIEYLIKTLPGVRVITPDYFPSTYWFTKWGGLAPQGWDQNSADYKDIIDLHNAVLRGAVLNDTEALHTAERLYLKNPGIMNMLKFQDFRCASYLISGVQHNFTQDSDSSTTLNLAFGQDNLVLLEPSGFAPIGFISLEKNMRMGWDNREQRAMFQSYPTQRSGVQNLYIEQFKEDLTFKRGNFLYTAQTFRNTANYMYELALERGIDVEYPVLTNENSIERESFNTTPPTPEESSERVDEVVRAYMEERRIYEEERAAARARREAAFDGSGWVIEE